MPLDAQARALMDQMAALGGPQIQDLSPVEARKMTGQGFIVPPDMLEKPARIENRKIPGPAGEIPVRIYAPEGTEMATCRAMVQTAPKKLELRELEIPEIGADDTLLRIEACGICGTDYELYDGAFPALKMPLIPGHEPVGIIERIGPIAAQRWGVREGDRVAVEPKVACGACRYCLSGSHRLCSAPGSTPTASHRLRWPPACGAALPPICAWHLAALCIESRCASRRQSP